MSHKTTDVSFEAYMPLEIKFHGTLNPIKKRLSLVFKLRNKKNTHLNLIGSLFLRMGQLQAARRRKRKFNIFDFRKKKINKN